MYDSNNYPVDNELMLLVQQFNVYLFVPVCNCLKLFVTVCNCLYLFVTVCNCFYLFLPVQQFNTKLVTYWNQIDVPVTSKHC